MHQLSTTNQTETLPIIIIKLIGDFGQVCGWPNSVGDFQVNPGGRDPVIGHEAIVWMANPFTFSSTA